MVGDSGRQTVVSNGFSKIAAGSISGETQDDARNTDPVLQPHRRDRCNGAAGRAGVEEVETMTARLRAVPPVSAVCEALEEEIPAAGPPMPA